MRTPPRLGRAIDWEDLKRIGHPVHRFSVRWDLPLADEELDLTDEVLDREHALSSAEFDEMLERKRADARAAAFFATLPEGHFLRPR